jgi:hypothetical protein
MEMEVARQIEKNGGTASFIQEDILKASDGETVEKGNTEEVTKKIQVR